jgi:hypothetical protein
MYRFAPFKYRNFLEISNILADVALRLLALMLLSNIGLYHAEVAYKVIHPSIFLLLEETMATSTNNEEKTLIKALFKLKDHGSSIHCNLLNFQSQ